MNYFLTIFTFYTEVDQRKRTNFYPLYHFVTNVRKKSQQTKIILIIYKIPYTIHNSLIDDKNYSNILY